MMLWIDLETRSDVDLIKHGLTRYAQDPSTQVISMAYAFDDDEVVFWWGQDAKGNLQTFPQQVIDYFISGGICFAHNADFERHLFDYVISSDYDFDAPKLEQWHCSMAVALTNGFAGGLDAASIGAGVPYKKHTSGTRLIKEYCATGHNDIFDPVYAEDRGLMEEYNVLDVEVMRALVKCCRELTADEWAEYHATCRVNERGIPIDRAFADQALGYANEVAEDANAHISKLTGGMMTKHTQRKARDAWLMPKLTEDQIKLLEIYKKGVKKISLDYEHRQYLHNREDLHPDARELLEYLDNAGSAVLRKYSVAHHQNVDGRVHNTFLWNGAGRTGRFSGKGLQPHNMRRDVFNPEEAEALIKIIMRQYEVPTPAATLARLSRAMIKSDIGLQWSDWSAIEGRVAPWLATTPSAEEKLDLYRDNKDVYIVTAAKMFDVEEASIDKEHPYRQSGKIAELSLQFGGGTGALIGMAKNYGVIFSDSDAQTIVRKWRKTNAWAESIWDDYQTAIDMAVTTPNNEYPVGRVSFFSDGHAFLWCKLPSGRLLSYPFPRWEGYTTPWGEPRVGATFQTHFKPAAGEEPLRIHARGALLFQNTVQAVAADLLRRALMEAQDEGLNVVLSVHDEIVIESGDPEDGRILNEIMLEVPDWGAGLPLATGGVKLQNRYGK
jgi:DNA polymerase bacteriophage-type